MSDARDDLREAIENAVAHQIPFRLIDHPLMVGFTQRATDAVLEVVRGVDADQWERRVVSVVPSPEHRSIGKVGEPNRMGDCEACGEPWPCPSTEPKEG